MWDSLLVSVLAGMMVVERGKSKAVNSEEKLDKETVVK